MSEILVQVEDVRKKFCRDLKRSLRYGVMDVARELMCRQPTTDRLREDEFWAVDEVSFELRRGECLGLIGRNGAGKTTLLKMLNGLIKPDQGRIELRGRVGALIALGAGFNPILSGRENIYINGSVLGLTKLEIEAKLEQMIDFAEIREFIDSPVQSYSSGMQVRLGFAVATALEPDILLVDEVLAVGDIRFRWKCLERIKQLKSRGVCIILVSHNSADLMRTCNRGVVLQRGELKFDGEITEAILGYENGPQALNSAPQLIYSGTQTSAVSVLGIRFRIQGEYACTMKSGEQVAVEIEIDSAVELPEVRIIVGFCHAEQGPLFHVSSYLEHQWIKLKAGRSVITLCLGALPIQFGSYYVQCSIRGPELGDIFQVARSSSSLAVTEPVPNFEGFGINGILMPACKWLIPNQAS